MKLKIFSTNVLLHAIFCFLGAILSFILLLVYGSAIEVVFLLGCFSLMFFTFGILNILVHVKYVKKGKKLQSYTDSPNHNLYVKIPKEYNLLFTIALFALVGFQFGGFGIIRYFTTGNKAQLVWLIFPIAFGIPFLTGLIFYLTKVVFSKEQYAKYQKERVGAVIGFTAAVIVAIPIFLLGIFGLILGDAIFGSLLMTLFGSILNFVLFKFMLPKI